MKIAGRRDYLVNLESVAMTDIILNMFIFFFISFSLLYTFSPQRVKQLEVKLPEAESASNIKSANQAAITITNEGLIYLNGTLLTKKALKDKVTKMIGENPQLSVIVNSDRLTSFGEVVSVLDILRMAGVKNLNIAAVADK